MLADLIAKVTPMLPKATLSVVIISLALAAAVLLGIVIDEWLQIRDVEKDMKRRREKVEKLIADLKTSASEPQHCAEKAKEQKKQLRRLLPLSGCLWHNS